MLPHFQAIGIECFVEPLLSITLLKTVSLQNVQTIIATSRHALKALNGPLDHVTAYCVGNGTALLAKDMGFLEIHTAQESVEDLLEMLNEKNPEALGSMLYVAGETITKNIEQSLEPLGYAIKTEVVYKATPQEQLSQSLLDHFAKGTIKQVGFFSNKTAEVFLQLAAHHQVLPSLQSMEALCLSQKIARALNPEQWKNIVIAPTPSTDSFWQLVKNHVECS